MKRSLMFDRGHAVGHVPAQAQKQQFDLSTMTCKRFFEYDKDNLAIMLMWLDGYYSDEDAPPIVDFDKMARTARSSAILRQESGPQRDHRGRQGDGRRK